MPAAEMAKLGGAGSVREGGQDSVWEPLSVRALIDIQEAMASRSWICESGVLEQVRPWVMNFSRIKEQMRITT